MDVRHKAGGRVRVLSAFIWETELGRRNRLGEMGSLLGMLILRCCEIPSVDVQLAVGSVADRRGPSRRQTIGGPHRDSKRSPSVGETE